MHLAETEVSFQILRGLSVGGIPGGLGQAAANSLSSCAFGEREGSMFWRVYPGIQPSGLFSNESPRESFLQEE